MRRGISFESITLTVYKAVYDLGEEGLEGFWSMVRHHEEKWNHVEGMPVVDSVVEGREYQCRKVVFLEKIVRAYEKRDPQSVLLTDSRMKPS